jgi:hypothetical protein
VKLRNRWPLPGNVFVLRAQRWFPWWFNEAQRLARLIARLEPDVVHSLEIQHAGYLTLAARGRAPGRFPPWVVTNWGNDTYYFRHFPEHEAQLRAVFAGCDYYDCECERDVRAARELGFRGTAFPVTPNTGGFDLEAVRALRQAGPPSTRRLILLKGYQNWQGRALTGLRALELCADVLRAFRIGVYLAGPETVRAAEQVARRTGLTIEIVPKCGHEAMLRLHGQARMSIGINATDGVSTSFLEALVMGSFPIQTCTACADEWVTDGETGFIVRPDDPEGIAAAIRRAATDDALVDRAAELNARTAGERLEYRKLKQQAVELYETVARERPRGAPN